MAHDVTDPAGPAARAAAPPPAEPSPHKKRPWVWIIVCSVLGLTAIGLFVWGLGQRSDAKDAEAAVSAQRAATEKAEAAGAETQQQYEDVSDQLDATNEDLDQISQDLDAADAKAQEAADAASKATSETEKAKAETDAAKADAEKAGACMRGTVDALGAAFSSGGLEAAVDELKQLSGRCR